MSLNEDNIPLAALERPSIVSLKYEFCVPVSRRIVVQSLLIKQRRTILYADIRWEFICGRLEGAY